MCLPSIMFLHIIFQVPLSLSKPILLFIIYYHQNSNDPVEKRKL